MKSGFRQSGFSVLLFLWFTFIGSRSDAAEASADASASVVLPVSVNNAIMVVWSAAIMSEATVGRRIIRIAGADVIKLTAGEGTLSGDFVIDLTVGATSAAGIVTVTVAYN